MNPKISSAFIFTIVLATFITGALVNPYLNNFRLSFGLPIALLMFWGLWALLPAIDPIAKGFPGFRYIYDLIWIMLSAVLACGYALRLGDALGWKIDIARAMMPPIAVLIFTAGALLPRIHRNWFFGIRTPWTLSSDEDWKRTHQFGKPLFMTAGILIFLGAFLPRVWGSAILIAAILGAALASVAYSYFVFHRK
ncbi:SdpI family protein [Patescibacteria group bacterium]|nr:SdpI family protein [Patescibacteria group bacterium]